MESSHMFNVLNVFVNYPLILIVIFTIISFYFKPNKKAIYLLDYACCEPPLELQVTSPRYVEHLRVVFKDNPIAAQFQMRILEKTGLGEETSLPPLTDFTPPRPHMDLARDEAHLVIFSVIDELFKKTGLEPKDISILVTNCSLFCPSPSFSSIIVNKYKMRSTIKTFSLSGMGCSASPISISLASNLLQVQPDSYALVVSTEIVTPNCYFGSDPSMLIPNCLFRLGGAAVLLTNKRAEINRAKYRLNHIIRTHIGSDDEAHNCMNQKEDPEGNLGVSLPRDLLAIVGEALKSNITSLGPLVLPISEKLKFGLHYLAQKPYIPNFNKAFDHFVIHTGGLTVINGLEKVLGLSAHQVEASRMSLHRFGNTSSSSIWYVLSYLEAKERMRKGDKVWQLSFGSGFKCNSVVWQCNRNIRVKFDGYGPWKDSIYKYSTEIASE